MKIALKPLLRRTVAERVAFCVSCRGVLPFAEIRYWACLCFGRCPLAGLPRTGMECGRCGTLYGRVDPGAAGRRRALRYLIYAGASGIAVLWTGMAAGLLGPTHPLFTFRDITMTWLLGALSLVCLARSLGLMAEAARFESLTALEMQEARRRLYPGMIRSDVIDELSRRGWRIGKIRTVLEGLRPGCGG